MDLFWIIFCAKDKSWSCLEFQRSSFEIVRIPCPSRPRLLEECPAMNYPLKSWGFHAHQDTMKSYPYTMKGHPYTIWYKESFLYHKDHPYTMKSYPYTIWYKDDLYGLRIALHGIRRIPCIIWCKDNFLWYKDNSSWYKKDSLYHMV